MLNRNNTKSGIPRYNDRMYFTLGFRGLITYYDGEFVSILEGKVLIARGVSSDVYFRLNRGVYDHISGYSMKGNAIIIYQMMIENVK